MSEPIQLKGGYTTTDIRLGRIPQFDDRSKQYPVRELVVEGRRLADHSMRSFSWSLGTQLDQGQTPACTGFSTAEELAARPVVVHDVTNDLGTRIYKRAQQLDEYPGEDYEGSSVLGAMKAATEMGYYSEYRWALGPGAKKAEEDLALAVGHHGPAVIGSNWYEGMFDANSDGYLVVEGGVAGGHAWVVTRFHVNKGYWTPNSWGGAGQGWVSRADMVRLLDEQGEAAIPVHRLAG